MTRDTFASISNTRLCPPPLTVTPTAGAVIDSVPLVLLSSSGPSVRVIVSGVSNTALSKSIVLAPALEFARPISSRNEPGPLSAVLVTVNVDIRLRSSSDRTVGCARRPLICRPSTVPRPPLR